MSDQQNLIEQFRQSHKNDSYPHLITVKAAVELHSPEYYAVVSLLAERDQAREQERERQEEARFQEHLKQIRREGRLNRVIAFAAMAGTLLSGAVALIALCKPGHSLQQQSEKAQAPAVVLQPLTNSAAAVQAAPTPKSTRQ